MAGAIILARTCLRQCQGFFGLYNLQNLHMDMMDFLDPEDDFGPEVAPLDDEYTRREQMGEGGYLMLHVGFGCWFCESGSIGYRHDGGDGGEGAGDFEADLPEHEPDDEQQYEEGDGPADQVAAAADPALEENWVKIKIVIRDRDGVVIVF